MFVRNYNLLSLTIERITNRFRKPITITKISKGKFKKKVFEHYLPIELFTGIYERHTNK